MTDNVYVTTAIPYVNAPPHVGFALELAQADAIARYHRLRGRNVRFQTGTDENAFKNVIAARVQGIPTRTLVDRNAGAFRELVDRLEISADRFIRTTENVHRNAVQTFWRALRCEDVYTANYSGLYCQGCEDFYLERDLVGGGCPEHGTPPVEVRERNYFFRLSAYEKRIEALIRDDALRVVPAARKNEVLAFVRQGLRDISISRSAERSEGWGIPVPGDPSQVVYVWIDALINYLSGLGYGSRTDWATFWGGATRKIHVIGKNVWKFHAVYWPALLISAGLPLPDEIVVHGFLTVGGRKIGKSLGNAVDPLALIDRYGAERLRYYLLRAIPALGDGDFSEESLAALCTAELSNGVGNTLSRVLRLAERSGFSPATGRPDPPLPKGYSAAFEHHRYDHALEAVNEEVVRLNRDIESVRPWTLGRKDAALAGHLDRWTRRLGAVATGLEPFLPGAAPRIHRVLRQRPLRAIDPLFPRPTPGVG